MSNKIVWSVEEDKKARLSVKGQSKQTEQQVTSLTGATPVVWPARDIKLKPDTLTFTHSEKPGSKAHLKCH